MPDQYSSNCQGRERQGKTEKLSQTRREEVMGWLSAMWYTGFNPAKENGHWWKNW